MEKIAIIVLGGAFSPVHQGHVNALNAAARIAEANGYIVVGQYMAVATQKYCL